MSVLGDQNLQPLINSYPPDQPQDLLDFIGTQIPSYFSNFRWSDNPEILFTDIESLDWKQLDPLSTRTILSRPEWRNSTLVWKYLLKRDFNVTFPPLILNEKHPTMEKPLTYYSHLYFLHLLVAKMATEKDSFWTLIGYLVPNKEEYLLEMRNIYLEERYSDLVLLAREFHQRLREVFTVGPHLEKSFVEEFNSHVNEMTRMGQKEGFARHVILMGREFYEDFLKDPKKEMQVHYSSYRVDDDLIEIPNFVSEFERNERVFENVVTLESDLRGNRGREIRYRQPSRLKGRSPLRIEYK